MPFRALAVLALLAASALSSGLAVVPAAAEGVGVVLLHAWRGTPNQFLRVVPRYEEAGFGVVAPEMCWSRKRLYGGMLDDCMADIDKAITDLHDKGYDQVVVGGHAMGALVAMYYADSHPVAGVLAMSPMLGKLALIEQDRDVANEAINSGSGDKPANFFNNTISVLPKVLLSFEGADGPLADEPTLVSHLSAPLLWIDANDSIGPRDPTPTFNLAPENALNTFIRSKTDYASLVELQVSDVIAWLDKIKAASAAK